MIEKILERLGELKVQAEDKWDGGASHKAYSNAISIVKEVAQEYSHRNSDLVIDSSHSNDGWIPVEERNPTLFESVYVTCSSLVDERPNWVIEGIYETEGWHGMSYMLSLGEAKVIAWMPKKVPSVYQPKGEKLFDKAECNSRNEAARKLDGLNVYGATLDEIHSAYMKGGKVGRVSRKDTV